MSAEDTVFERGSRRLILPPSVGGSSEVMRQKLAGGSSEPTALRRAQNGATGEFEGIYPARCSLSFLEQGLISCLILELLAAPPGCWCSQRPLPVPRRRLTRSQHPAPVWCRGSSVLASEQPACLSCLFLSLALIGLALALLPRVALSPQLSVHSGVTLFPVCCIPSGSWKSQGC